MTIGILANRWIEKIDFFGDVTVVLLNIILKSFFVGVGGACVIGPIFLLILNRALKFGFLAGFYSGLGVALSDGILFGLGFAGVVSIAWKSQFLAKFLEFLGGVILILVGLKTIWGIYKAFRTSRFWMSFEQENEELLYTQEQFEQSNANLFWMGFGLFLLNITNPMILVFFATVASRVFPELLGNQISFLYATFAAISTFLGSALVFTACSFFAAFISKVFIPSIRRIIEILTALFFIGTGFYLLKNLTNFDFLATIFSGWFNRF